MRDGYAYNSNQVVMALASVTALGLRNSLMTSTNNLTALCKPLSTIGMLRPKKIVTPITKCMSFTVTADDAQRRTGNHHSNIWDDDVIHSLSTSYGVFSLISINLLFYVFH